MAGNNISEEDLNKMSPEEIAELQKQNCIFCKIVSKEIPAKIIHEDADIICILDINPASEGHILVYPKKHYMILPHIPEDILQKVFKNVKLMSHTLLKSLQCKGTTIFIANGAAAGQKAPHVLVHVFPRRENDGLVKLPNYELSEEQLEKLKIDLGRYVSQVFGQRKPVIKNAEFTEYPKETSVRSSAINSALTKEIEHRRNVSDSNDEDNTVRDDTEDESNEDDVDEDSENEILENKKEIKEKKSHKSSTKKTTHAKEDKKDNKPNETKNANNSKIDLDDIAKLFG